MQYEYAFTLDCFTYVSVNVDLELIEKQLNLDLEGSPLNECWHSSSEFRLPSAVQFRVQYNLERIMCTVLCIDVDC